MLFVSFSVNSAMNPITVKYVKIEEHISISPMTAKKGKPKGNIVNDQFLLCSYLPSFDSFDVLTKENRKFLSEFKESLLIMRYNVRLIMRDSPVIILIRFLLGEKSK